MQQAGFLNHTGNTAKISRSVSGLAQAYAEGGRKKRNQGQGECRKERYRWLICQVLRCRQSFTSRVSTPLEHCIHC
jgi:hypothetical protein